MAIKLLLTTLLLPLLACLQATAQQRVYLPRDSQAAALLQQLAEHRRAGHWNQALTVFDRLAEGLARHKFKHGLYGKGPVAVELDEALLALLVGWPETAVRAFRAQYGAVARRQLSRASRPRDLWRVVRYFNTDAAADALTKLAAHALEAGRGAEALRALRLASQHPNQPLPRGRLLAQRLLIWRMLGREGRVRDLLANARHTEVVLGGQRMPIDKALGQFRRRDPQFMPRSQWPTLGGRNDRRALAQLGPLPGKPLWQVSLGTIALSRSTERALLQRGLDVPRPGPACTDGRRIYVAGVRSLITLGATRGDLVWRYPELPGPAGRPRAPRPRSCQLDGDELFTVLEGEVLCFTAASGKLRWKVTLKAQQDRAFFDKVTALSGPLVEGDRVWVVATRIAGDVETHLLAFDRAGRRGLLSRHLLATSPSPRFLGFSYPTAPASLTGDLLAVQTGHGALLLIDKRTGLPRWGLRYPRMPRVLIEQRVRDAGLRAPGPIGVQRGVLYFSPPDATACLAVDTIGRRLSWSHPLERGERLMAVAGDAIYVGRTTLRALNAQNGRVLWRANFATPIVSLLAGREALAVCTTDRLIRLDRASGKRLDTVQTPFAGQLAPCGDRLVLTGLRQAALLADRKKRPASPPDGPTLTARATRALARGAANPELLARLARSTAKIDPGVGVHFPPRELAQLLAGKPIRTTGPTRTPRTVWKSAYPTSLRSSLTRFIPILGAHSKSVKHPLGIADGSRIQFRDGYSGALLWHTRCSVRPLGLATVGKHGIAVLPGLVMAFDLSTGAPSWAYIPQLGRREGPAASATRLSGWFTAKRIRGVSVTSKRVLIATHEQLVALDAVSGKPMWDSVHGAAGIHTLLATSRALLLVESSGGIQVRSLETGNLLHQIGAPRATKKPLLAATYGKLVIVGYKTSAAQAWVAFDPTRQSALFRIPAPTGTVSLPGSNRYLVLKQSNQVVVHDLAETGKRAWKTRGLSLRRDRPLVGAISGGDLILAWRDSDLRVARHDLASGKRRWLLSTSANRTPMQVVPYGDRSLILPARPFKHFFLANGPARQLRKQTLAHRHSDIHAAAQTGAAVAYITDAGLVALSQRPATAARSDLIRHWSARNTHLGGPAVARNLAELVGHHRAADSLHDAYDKLPDDSLATQLRFIDAAQGHMELAGEKRAHRTVLQCRRMQKPPMIDGVLTEPYDRTLSVRLNGLKALRLLVSPSRDWTRWRGLEDLSARIHTGWDKKYFYLAMLVRDKRGTLFAEEDSRWVGDAAVFSFDSDDKGGYRYDRSRHYAFWVFHPRPRSKKKQRQRPHKTSGVPGVKSAITWGDDGTTRTYELAIPWTLMRRMQPVAGRCFGFNILLLDDDSGRGVTRAMSLAPGNLLDPRRKNFVQRFHPQRFVQVRLVD